MAAGRYTVTLALAGPDGPVGEPHHIEVLGRSPAQAMIEACVQLPAVLAEAFEMEAAQTGDPQTRLDAQRARALSDRVETAA